ncbi:MAG: hypothetical protein FRX49_11832 [Trebouxia sp. A1-2]|nr:MAG: hypothetical protein FRX49_11832 [Trebouxia sp. A1-2]
MAVGMTSDAAGAGLLSVLAQSGAGQQQQAGWPPEGSHCLLPVVAAQWPFDAADAAVGPVLSPAAVLDPHAATCPIVTNGMPLPAGMTTPSAGVPASPARLRLSPTSLRRSPGFAMDLKLSQLPEQLSLHLWQQPGLELEPQPVHETQWPAERGEQPEQPQLPELQPLPWLWQLPSEPYQPCKPEQENACKHRRNPLVNNVL